MPELPEVETMRRSALPAVGKLVTKVRCVRCARKPLRVRPGWPAIARHLTGRRLEAIDRHGKRLLLRFTGPRWLIIEPRMSGLLVLGEPPGRDHLRFVLEFGDRAGGLAYWDRRGLGHVWLVDEQGLARYLSPARIGPDALAVSAATLRKNLETSQTAIKTGLLNQKAVAGIGNIYASEILHLAGVDPRKPCNALSSRDWIAVHRASGTILKRAIRMEGSTLGDGTYRSKLNRPGRYQNRHRVYGRQGKTCPTCGEAAIQRIVQTGRATYFCPLCQPALAGKPAVPATGNREGRKRERKRERKKASVGRAGRQAQ
jgi:formamidopyrimidine-DNA glycosylase